MKYLKKVAAILLVVCMVFSLAACGGDAKKLVGSWKAEIEFGDIMDKALKEVPEGVDADALAEIKITIEMTLDDDGEGKVSIDKKALAKDMQEVMVDLMKKQFEAAMIAQTGLTKAQIEAQSGMTMDQLLEQSLGTTVEKKVQELVDEQMEDNEELLDRSFDYEIEDGKLVIDDEEHDYELDEDELTLTGETDDGDEIEITFKRED